MSSKFELSIDMNYVKSWGIVEAVREFFQNSYDEEQQNPNNKSYFNYDEDSEILTIGNKLSVLKSETLLLGCTSKDSDNSTIGQFGEGYKIATVVALRTGHNVTIYNYGAREIWTTKLVKSRRYNGRLVPTFYINKTFDWKSFFNNKEERNLYIEITNISKDEYEKIVESNLNLKPFPGNKVNTQFGEILSNESFSGRIYVSGLYVCTDERVKYNYNINSNYLKLDRDRMAVDSFNLCYTTSKMWLDASINDSISVDLLFEMLENNCEDIHYINSIIEYSCSMSNVNNVIDNIYLKFIEKYGKDSIPVNSDDLKKKLESCGNKTTYVKDSLYNILSRYKGDDTIIVKTETLYSRYKKLLDSLKKFMDDSQKEEMEYLLSNSYYLLGGDQDED